MRYLKMLGVAAVATVVVATLGVSTASAAGGVLCEDVTEPCDSKWGFEADMGFSLVAKTKTKLTSGFGATLLECSESGLTGKVLSAGTKAERARLEVKKEWLTWGKCSPEEKGTPPTTVTPGELEFEWRNEPETKGTVFAKKLVFKALLGGFNCHYTLGAGTDLGLYTPGAGGKDGIIKVTSEPLALENSAAHPSSTVHCPATVIWDAEYTLTTDTALYIKQE
jgi:hypothetical protein